MLTLSLRLLNTGFSVLDDHTDEPRFGRRSPSERLRADDDALYRENEFAEEAEPRPLRRPPPRKRSKSARSTTVRFFNFLLTLAFVGVAVFAGMIWFGKQQFDQPGPLAAATTFDVPKGATFNSIVPGLEAKNIIPTQGPLRVFVRGVQAAGKAGDLKVGEYGFQAGMSMRQVMLELTEGKPITYTITFPEGWTSYKMMERLAFEEKLTGDVPPIPAEGSLMPDTYTFSRGTTRTQIVERMKQAQQKALREVWANRVDGLPIETPADLVNLASIVEKETGVGSERPHVASVFINRLRKGMRLETDPTIIYGIWGGKGKPSDRGGLRRSELKKETPYNTYQIDGLPPTPIANPGLASMKAVAQPLETDDLFFVADGTGGHVFAKTLKEHNANVRNWRKIEAERKKEAEEAAKEAEPKSNETQGASN